VEPPAHRSSRPGGRERVNAEPALIDLERVICTLTDLEGTGARAFTFGEGGWPLRGFVVRVASEVRGYLNRCPHAAHPLDLLPGCFLTPDRTLIQCGSHGALFEKATGYCVAGPCAGGALTPIALEVVSGYVMVAEDVERQALADAPG
jgi:nitrite reductase/ring-hydroxylating ferredoxin subunit